MEAAKGFEMCIWRRSGRRLEMQDRAAGTGGGQVQMRRGTVGGGGGASAGSRLGQEGRMA